VNYSYDAQGYLSGVSVNPGNPNGVGVSGTAVTLLLGIGYNSEEQITGWLWSDSKARTIACDANGLISAYSLGDPNIFADMLRNLRLATPRGGNERVR